jgi:hypothetical protein
VQNLQNNELTSHTPHTLWISPTAYTPRPTALTPKGSKSPSLKSSNKQAWKGRRLPLERPLVSPTGSVAAPALQLSLSQSLSQSHPHSQGHLQSQSLSLLQSQSQSLLQPQPQPQSQSQQSQCLLAFGLPARRTPHPTFQLAVRPSKGEATLRLREDAALLAMAAHALRARPSPSPRPRPRDNSSNSARTRNNANASSTRSMEGKENRPNGAASIANTASASGVERSNNDGRSRCAGTSGRSKGSDDRADCEVDE